MTSKMVAYPPHLVPPVSAAWDSGRSLERPSLHWGDCTGVI